MSSYTGLLPNYRLVGNYFYGNRGAYGGWGLHHFYPIAGTYPAIADSYLPQYQSPQTRYGSCVCQGGAMIQNNCNYQQGGYRPQCLMGGGCRCVDPTGTDWGCWSLPRSTCD
jgi:hypothetical protein